MDKIANWILKGNLDLNKAHPTTRWTAFEQEKISTQKIKDKKLYWINHSSCRFCRSQYSRYSKTTRNCCHLYNHINNCQTWLVLIVLRPKVIWTVMKTLNHCAPLAPSWVLQKLFEHDRCCTDCLSYPPSPQKMFLY